MLTARRFCLRLLAATFAVMFPCAAVTGVSTLPDRDPRAVELVAFFESYGCPRPHYAEEYIRAADRSGLDYRLLPAISMAESTCGLYQRLNNHWGWNSAKSGFRSVMHGIAYITAQLAGGPQYRNKTLDQKLYTYNPRLEYVRKVKKLMAQMNSWAAGER
jgi:hypothetical protein